MENIQVKEITRINHLGLRVKDLNVSREFYEKLGVSFLAWVHRLRIPFLENPRYVVIATSQDVNDKRLHLV